MSDYAKLHEGLTQPANMEIYPHHHQVAVDSPTQITPPFEEVGFSLDEKSQAILLELGPKIGDLRECIDEKQRAMYKEWSDPQKREDLIQEIEKLNSELNLLLGEWSQVKGNMSNVEYAFYSEESAIQKGYTLCPLAQNPRKAVRVTHVFPSQNVPRDQQYLQLRFVGVIPVGSINRGLHCHVPGKTTCQVCTYKHNFGRLPDENIQPGVEPHQRERERKKYKSKK